VRALSGTLLSVGMPEPACRIAGTHSEFRAAAFFGRPVRLVPGPVTGL
jgi:hypothetical protein